MNDQHRERVTHNHRKLTVWQEAVKLVEMVYRATRGFPKDETFGLTRQLRRSAVSVPSNIAEGAGRNSTKELVQFLGVASGSLAELDTQLEVARRLGYLNGASEVIS
jgi:four helix bundle protein